MKIFLMRHGQSTGDVENRYGGDYDDDLTHLGVNQAEELAKKLIGQGIEIIFSSPRKRAKKVAEIVVQTLQCQLEIVSDARERNAYGILTGLKKEEASQKYSEEVCKLKDYRSMPTDGEDYSDFKERVLRFWTQVTSGPQKVIGIVTHGGPIRCLIREVFGLGELTGDLPDCAVIEIEKAGDEFRIIKMA